MTMMNGKFMLGCALAYMLVDLQVFAVDLIQTGSAFERD